MKIFILLFIALLTSPAYAADEEDKYVLMAQKAIDDCWAISQEDRDSGNTTRMRAGHLDTALCMEDHIVYLSKNYLYKNSPELVQEAEERLGMLREGYGRLYWNLYNNHDGCYTNGLPWCGTMFNLFQNNYYAKMLEDIVKDHYKQIK